MNIADNDALVDFVRRDLPWCLEGKPVSLHRIASRVVMLHQRLLRAAGCTDTSTPLLRTPDKHPQPEPIHAPTDAIIIRPVGLECVANSIDCATPFDYDALDAKEGAQDEFDTPANIKPAPCFSDSQKLTARGLANVVGLLIHRHPSGNGNLYVRATACACAMLSELLEPSGKSLPTMAKQYKVTHAYMSRLGLELADALHMPAPWQRLAARQTYKKRQHSVNNGNHCPTDRWQRDKRRKNRANIKH